MFQELLNYILIQLYDKLFPKESSAIDNIIYDQCVSLSWIEPSHVGVDPKINVNSYLPFTIQLMNQIDKVKSPNDKLEILTKVIDCISKSLKLCLGIEGTIDDYLPSLMLVIVKSKPKYLSTTLQYLNMYHHDLKNKINVNTLSLFIVIKQRLENFSYQDLVDVEESEYIKKCEEANNQTEQGNGEFEK